MKWLIAMAALVVVSIPAAYAASPNKEKPKTESTAQTQSAHTNAAKACKAERASLGVDAFAKKYGTNHNLRNAFGKCVSQKSKGKETESKGDNNSKGDDNESGDKGSNNAAKQCKAERASLGAGAFAKKYGTNPNLRNAFGKCVSGKSKASGTKDDD